MSTVEERSNYVESRRSVALKISHSNWCDEVISNNNKRLKRLKMHSKQDRTGASGLKDKSE
jgi:hypothetical protein